MEILGSVIVLFASLLAILADIGASTVGLSISYALQISGTLNMLVRMTAEVETNIVAIERIDEYSGEPQEAPWKTVDVVSKCILCELINSINLLFRIQIGHKMVQSTSVTFKFVIAKVSILF